MNVQVLHVCVCGRRASSQRQILKGYAFYSIMFSCVGAVPHLLHSDDRCADHARCGIPKRVLVATVNFETNTRVNSV